MEAYTGVINPYALAELVIGKKIKWDNVEEREKLLANILNIPEADIFDIQKSPVLAPHIKIKSPEEIEHLSQKDAMDKVVKSFEAIKFSPHEEIPFKAKNTEKVIDIVNNMILSCAESPNSPWNPPNVEWIDKGALFDDVDEFNDPIQGALGDCYFIAAMSSVAWSRPYAIANVVRPSSWSEESPIHKVDFYKNGSTHQKIEVSERVPVRKGTHHWIYARSLDPGEIWPAVLEKAYAKWKTNNPTDQPDYTRIAGGDPVKACAEIVSGRRYYYWNKSYSATQLWNIVRSNSLGKRTFNPMVAWTYCSPPADIDYKKAGLVSCHAYSILGWEYQNYQKYIVLRNPWGTHHATLDTLSGYWWARFINFWVQIPLNRNGVFAMKAETFKKYFAGMGVVR